MRHVLTVAVAVAVAGAIACNSQPQLIPGADLVPPGRLEATLQPVAGWRKGNVQSNKVSGERAMTRAEGVYYRGGDTLDRKSVV